MTLSAYAVSKKRLDKIESNRSEVRNSASIDLEWLPYKGKYEHNKTKIFAASFCTNWGERIVLHISKYSGDPNPEKALIQDILFYLNQFPLTFGWYTTGVAVYDDTAINRIKGRDSDFFVLHERCVFHNLTSPIVVKKTYARLADSNKKHTDLNKVFGKTIIQNGVFEGRYRTTDLDSVSQALLGIGKYGRLNAGISDICSLPVEEQKRYVRRDSELAMLLAQYNNCLALRIMKIFAGYSGMDYFIVCDTEISKWYANRYKRMLESGECTVSYTPNYKLDKQVIGGGHHTHPTKGFFTGTKIYELDVKGQYPSIVINNNFSFDTLNCTCCKYNENACVKQETIDTINKQLQEDNIPRKVDRYWVCQKRKGAFPKVLEQTLADRNKYLNLLKEVKDNPDCNLNLVEEYQTHQLGAKLFANAGFGLFGNEYFEFSNYQVAECITAEGRRIHKQMESLAQNEPYNFEVVFGFTDSTFFRDKDTEADVEKVQNFIQICKDKLGVIVELKTVFINSIFYPKKNRYVAWTGNEKDEPIIKGLDGLSDSNPLWVRRWFKKIVVEIVKHPETRFEVIPQMITEAFDELDSGCINHEEELKFTQRLKLHLYEYKGHPRIVELAKLLDKDKGDLVSWYETYTEEYDKRKLCWKKKKSYSVKPDNLNLDEYKNLLLNKLTDSLEIAGFKMDDLASHMPKRCPFINSEVLSNNLQPTPDDYIKNFPFPTLREKQSFVLKEIAAAFASGYKYIVLEAPTGFGKSPVAVAVALTLGTSYICTSTKDLQTQYARDFPFLKVAKGKHNFPCAVKEDFIVDGTYKCGLCVSNNVNECYHTTADYGPCMSKESFKKRGCRYRTFLKDYKVNSKGTREEEVFIGQHTNDYYKQEYSQWMHLKNLNEKREWRPCEYYDQLNVALTASHSIFNYSNFLAFLPTKTPLPPRELLILDETHLLESEIVRFREISISKRRWRKYIPNLHMVDYGYDDVEKWIDFLIELEARMLVLTGQGWKVEELSIFRRERYNWTSKIDSFNKKKIDGASDIVESDEKDEHIYTTSSLSEELVVEAIRTTEKLTDVIDNILSNPKNWIVSGIKREGHEVVGVELKPLDVSPYCQDVFEKCKRILMMSATILDKDAFCASLGLAPEEVKFIEVPSDFPLQNRTIYPLNVVYLNYDALHKDAVKRTIAGAIDRIMTQHKDHKGIIHTASYEQLNFIKEDVSRDNRRRLLETDPEVQRDEIIKEHINATRPTVLISPSLHLGLDLKDDLSRFQVITKVPYPNLGDKWINEKRKRNENWYTWQTALRLVQGYGRSIRSKEDWAKTYVLDSAFRPFVMKNKNILPHWFIQAIQSR